MSIPTKCNLPDLSNLKPLAGRLIVRLLVGDPVLNGNVGLYFREYVRLIGKALYEYTQARNVVIEVVKEFNYRGKNPPNNARLNYAFEFPNHMETCINAIRRLYNLQDGINRTKKEFIIIPRDLRKIIQSYFDPIKDVRDEVEHLDEKINLQISQGEPIMLTVNDAGDGIMISSFEIKFTEIANVLKNMHQIAVYILEHNSSTPNSI
jgi:hypothetical protein